jgi:hypothetical protein
MYFNEDVIRIHSGHGQGAKRHDLRAARRIDRDDLHFCGERFRCADRRAKSQRGHSDPQRQSVHADAVYNDSGDSNRGRAAFEPSLYLISAIRMMMGIGTPSSHSKIERMIAS